MTEPLYGVDLSNWNGPLSAAQAECLHAAGFTVGVVRLSLETADKIALAKQQMAALQAAGLTVMGYAWEYATDNPLVDAQVLIATYRDAPLCFLWVDAEETKYVQDVAGNQAWLRAYLPAVAVRWPVGIYTAPWWWRPQMGDTAEFSSYPLWYANYDGVPSLANPGPFGGWTGPLAGKQYTASGTPCGFTNLDLDVFDPALLDGTNGGDDLSQAERDELASLRDLKTYTDALTGTILPSALGTLEAAAGMSQGALAKVVRSQCKAVRDATGITA